MATTEPDAVDDVDLQDDEVEAQPTKGAYACPLDGCGVTGESAAGIKRHLTKVHRVNGRDYDIQRSARLTYGATVFGPDGEKVRLLFYPSGAIRVRLNEAAPMGISEAFLSGSKGQNVIIKLVPLA